MRSLKTRLTAALSLSLLLLLGLQYWVVSGAIRATAEDYVASRLRHDTEGLLAGLRDGPEGGLSLSARDAIYRRPYSGHYYRIQAGAATLRSRSLWESRLPMPAVAVGDKRLLHVSGPQDQPLLVRVAAFRKDARVIRIAVAEDLSPLRADLAAFQWRYGLVSGAVAAVLVALQWLLVALGMRPLRRLRRQIGQLERGERQTLSEEVPSEIRPLVVELNRLLGVLGERLARSRNALGDLAHALKAPLTRLFQAAEEPAIRDTPDLRHRVLDPARTIQARIERELGRARLAAGSPGQRFEPGRELPALLRTLERMYAERGLDLRYRGPAEGPTYGDREDLVELVGNLLDNACKWASSRVRVTVAVDNGLTLEVADDGPGVPPEQRDALTQRGTRLDEGAEGHGLGLAIVGDIVRAYRGSLTLASADELGGLAVRVHLPGPGRPRT